MSYESIYTKWLNDNYPDQAGSWTEYVHATSCIHEMRQRGLWQEFEQSVAEFVGLLNKQCDKAQAISNIHGMLVAMKMQYEKTVPQEDLDI